MALAFALMAAAGCSNGGRDFAVPEAVCGTPVEPSALSPLLPPEGKKLAEDGHALPTTDTGCTVDVDGYSAVTFGKSSTNERFDPVRVLEGVRRENVQPLRHLPVQGSGAIADSAAMVTIECEADKKQYFVLRFEFGDNDNHYPSEVDERRRAIRRFVENVARNAVQEERCSR
ncbi:hypothetical protein [Streptomyces qinglanensis]|uniref:hypothetical protein n=1 Tax=Streptomyces qinglanensis TaxID=943816 RepID=UPI003D750EA0